MSANGSSPYTRRLNNWLFNRFFFPRDGREMPGISLRWLFVIGLAFGLFVFLFHLGPAGRDLENKGYDLLFRLRGPLPSPDDLIIVAVDDHSFAELGRQWPWPRSFHARLVKRLARAGARAIAFDIIFDQPSIPAEDVPLRQALSQAGNVILAADLRVIETLTVRQTLRVNPLPELEKASAGVGLVNLLLDPDNVIRRARLTLGETRTFAAALARFLGWTGFDIPFLINYVGPTPAFTTVSYSQALSDDDIPDHFFKEKIVLIGRSVGAPGRPVEDTHFTPYSTGGLQIPGIEIHAAILDTILRQRPIRSVSLPLTFFWFLAWSIAASLVLGKLLPWSGLAASLALVGTELGISVTAFSSIDLWIPWVSPALSTGGVYVGLLAIRWRKAEKEKMHIRNCFQHYIHPAVVQQIISDPTKLQLGGESVLSTVLFSDLQDFTRVAETLTPLELVKFLNEYFSAMTEIILFHHGMLNRTIGDGILALWGVPVQDPDHALGASRAALAMQRRLGELNSEWAKQGRPPLRMRIGIQSGEIVVGNIGSTERFDYTAIGDNVNLASRLEEINKLYKTGIILGEETARRVANQLELRELDRIRVVGRVEPLVIDECLGEVGSLSEKQLALFEQFNSGLRLYRRREWCKALENFEEAITINPDDGPSHVYIERCRLFLSQPPPEDWDGVFSALGKQG
jgi:adenylate cyclase